MDIYNNYEFNKLTRQLSKLRFTLRYLLEHHDWKKELTLKPELIVLWGEVNIVTNGNNFDGASPWYMIVRHIIKVGLAHVTNWARTKGSEVQLIKVSGLVRELRNAVFCLNKGGDSHPIEYGYLKLG